jgi:hypothetical protein
LVWLGWLLRFQGRQAWMDGMSAFGGASIALGDSSGLRFFDPFLSLIVYLDGDIFRCMDAWMDGIIGRGLVEASGAYLSDYIFLFAWIHQHITIFICSLHRKMAWGVRTGFSIFVFGLELAWLSINPMAHGGKRDTGEIFNGRGGRLCMCRIHLSYHFA